MANLTLTKPAGLQTVQSTPAQLVARDELESQIDVAHKYPRDISRAMARATGMATLTQDVAESCLYSLPRSGKQIAGPSVRLAEIMASAWGNLQIASRIIDVTETEVVAQGAVWDVENNVRITTETRRRITDKNGRKYNDDMVIVTGNAAASIAIRNAIFRVVPKPFVDQVYHAACEVSVGNAKTLATRREEVVSRLQKMGVPRARILAAVEKSDVDGIGLEELKTLIGLGSAIKNGESSIDEAFPAPSKADALNEKLAPKVDADGVVQEAVS